MQRSDVTHFTSDPRTCNVLSMGTDHRFKISNEQSQFKILTLTPFLGLVIIALPITSGTGKGGESAFGSTFPDHFKPNLTHSGRGVLSMANRGPNTNTSQFFFTYRSCNHLDNKHTVFGRLVGGIKVGFVQMSL